MKQTERKPEVNMEQDYPRNLQVALSISLISIILLFSLLKGMQITPYSRPQAENITMLEEMAALEDITVPPPPVQRPQVQVEVAEPGETPDEVDVNADIDNWDFGNLDVAPPQVDSVFEPYAVEIPPEITAFVTPEYPEVARQAGIEGRVVVQVVVDENGRVIPGTERILTSTNEVFNEPALVAAMACTFKPGQMGDRKVKVRVNIPFAFRLR
ncbi:MAG: TonB family protein [candidate division WOR-3 bacterium]